MYVSPWHPPPFECMENCSYNKVKVKLANNHTETVPSKYTHGRTAFNKRKDVGYLLHHLHTVLLTEGWHNAALLNA